ncbi:hypothetical protein VTK73DRAFT_2415 [Phialemonium thermophilum]|uniref:Uncharacterized protein n=1 Tax=Phialemonium thermophilum TaxID=223376 RepID=A0ABR3VS70_9PEZI
MSSSIPLRLLLGAWLVGAAAADAGDDFSNNLFTDLGPLLALFGERVTTQFLRQATSWADNLIIAMAPLGIITIIVSAIRVGGPQWLRSIIGRATEPRAVVEAELMSSTSERVCELWDDGNIVRVVGQAPIQELIVLYDERETKEEDNTANFDPIPPPGMEIRSLDEEMNPVQRPEEMKTAAPVMQSPAVMAFPTAHKGELPILSTWPREESLARAVQACPQTV